MSGRVAATIAFTGLLLGGALACTTAPARERAAAPCADLETRCRTHCGDAGARSWACRARTGEVETRCDCFPTPNGATPPADATAERCRSERVACERRCTETGLAHFACRVDASGWEIVCQCVEETRAPPRRF